MRYNLIKIHKHNLQYKARLCTTIYWISILDLFSNFKIDYQISKIIKLLYLENLLLQAKIRVYLIDLTKSKEIYMLNIMKTRIK